MTIQKRVTIIKEKCEKNLINVERMKEVKELIKLNKVKKTYQVGDEKFNALDGINITINKGEFVVILGPSGAGKSTLLNLLGGMDRPTSGDIIVDGENISKYSDANLTNYRASKVGFIFQFYNILPTLTVLENVLIVKDIVKTPLDAKKVLKSVGLQSHINKFPNQLSGGEQQRVSIARAIAKSPTLLLCDEPTGALDSKTGVEILELLKEQCDANNGENTVIIVTHNALIASVADRVIRLKNGKIESNEINNHPKNIDEVVW